MDQDKSGDLNLAELTKGLQAIRGEVGHGTVTNKQIDEFVIWLDEDQSGDIDAREFVSKVDYCTAKEAEAICAQYKPVSHSDLLIQEAEEEKVLLAKLEKCTHLRRGLWDRGTTNEQEVQRLLDVDREIHDIEVRMETIALVRAQRNGPHKSEVSDRIKKSISPQAIDREEQKSIKKTRRQSIALVNALQPHLKKEAGGSIGDSKEDTRNTKPVAFQAVSMAISDMLRYGKKKLNGYGLVDAE